MNSEIDFILRTNNSQLLDMTGIFFSRRNKIDPTNASVLSSYVRRLVHMGDV